MLTSKKYTQKQVDDLLSEIKGKLNLEIGELKEKIAVLERENEKLSSKVFDYKSNEKIISKAIKDAEKQAESVINSARLKYDLAVERTKKFNQLIDIVIANLKSSDKDKLVKADSIRNNIAKILKIGVSSEQKVEQINKVLSNYNKPAFNPKEKIQNYIDATETDCGFNMNDVLNPGKLELEDLCKELGLMKE